MEPTCLEFRLRKLAEFELHRRSEILARLTRGGRAPYAKADSIFADISDTEFNPDVPKEQP